MSFGSFRLYHIGSVADQCYYKDSFRQHLLTKNQHFGQHTYLIYLFLKNAALNQNDYHDIAWKLFLSTNIILSLNFEFYFSEKNEKNMKRPHFWKKLFFQPPIGFYRNDLKPNFFYQNDRLVLQIIVDILKIMISLIEVSKN